MQKEYNFTNAEQGKFYRPIEELELPIHMDENVNTVKRLLALDKNYRELLDDLEEAD